MHHNKTDLFSAYEPELILPIPGFVYKHFSALLPSGQLMCLQDQNWVDEEERRQKFRQHRQGTRQGCGRGGAASQ